MAMWNVDSIEPALRVEASRGMAGMVTHLLIGDWMHVELEDGSEYEGNLSWIELTKYEEDSDRIVLTNEHSSVEICVEDISAIEVK